MSNDINNNVCISSNSSNCSNDSKEKNPPPSIFINDIKDEDDNKSQYVIDDFDIQQTITPPTTPINNENNNPKTHKKISSFFDNQPTRLSKKIETMEIFKHYTENDNSIVSYDNDDNGWNNNTKNEIKKWYDLFKKESFKYQFILDNSIIYIKRLNLWSIIISLSLGIFTSFKLLIQNEVFQLISNILILLANLSVAYIINLSKNATDDKKNEKIKFFIEDLELFLTKLSSQILKVRKYRMHATIFFQLIEDKYNDLLLSAPILTIEEIKNSNQAYSAYSENIL